MCGEIYGLMGCRGSFDACQVALDSGRFGQKCAISQVQLCREVFTDSTLQVSQFPGLVRENETLDRQGFIWNIRVKAALT